jgi:uncharacterized protein (TIGR01777 family)
VNVLIAGGSGFIGEALTRYLVERGHRVAILSRRLARGDARTRGGAPAERATASPTPTFHWDPAREELDPQALDGVDAVVNLAGENLAGGRWTQERKRRLVESRVLPTRFLVRRLGGRKPLVPALVNASAMGAYGNRGDEILTEESPRGRGFLADLCRDWEEAALQARDSGVRVAVLRFGLAIGAAGGVLQKLVPIFKLGVGGPLGSGRQWMSWIGLSDLVRAIELALTRDDVRGIVNVVAPAPVRNRDFARILGRVLRRPAILPAPAPALRLLYGEMADEAVLSSACVAPLRLPALGYRFDFEDLERTLRSTLRA